MGWRHSSVDSSVPTHHPATPGSSPKFFQPNFYSFFHCDEKRTKISKQRPGLAHFLTTYMNSVSTQQFADTIMPIRVRFMSDPTLSYQTIPRRSAGTTNTWMMRKVMEIMLTGQSLMRKSKKSVLWLKFCCIVVLDMDTFGYCFKLNLNSELAQADI